MSAFGLFLFLSFFSCSPAQKEAEHAKPELKPSVIPRPKPSKLTREQRLELGFSSDLIEKLETAAGSAAEPFFTTVYIPSENLKGDKGFEKRKLAGFSVRTQNADELISSYRKGLRTRGYLIFRSQRSYGSLPETVSVVKGNNSYDILKIQATEALNYHLDTAEIITWLRAQQRAGSFVITGAGSDWLEARFVKPPADMHAFAKTVSAFAPDVLGHGRMTVDKLAEIMSLMNGFHLEWD